MAELMDSRGACAVSASERSYHPATVLAAERGAFEGIRLTPDLDSEQQAGAELRAVAKSSADAQDSALVSNSHIDARASVPSADSAVGIESSSLSYGSAIITCATRKSPY